MKIAEIRSQESFTEFFFFMRSATDAGIIPLTSTDELYRSVANQF